MAEFELNEEQKDLMRKLADDANKLNDKYSHMKEAFEIIVNNIEEKMNSCEDENIKKVKEETENLISQITYVREKLGKVNYLARGYDAYKSATKLLLEVQSMISDVRYELGKLEGYSSGKIYTYVDSSKLIGDYLRLEKSLLE